MGGTSMGCARGRWDEETIQLLGALPEAWHSRGHGAVWSTLSSGCV